MGPDIPWTSTQMSRRTFGGKNFGKVSNPGIAKKAFRCGEHPRPEGADLHNSRGCKHLCQKNFKLIFRSLNWQNHIAYLTPEDYGGMTCRILARGLNAFCFFNVGGGFGFLDGGFSTPLEFIGLPSESLVNL